MTTGQNYFTKVGSNPFQQGAVYRINWGDLGLYKSGYEMEQWFCIGQSTERHFSDNQMFFPDLSLLYSVFVVLLPVRNVEEVF